MDKKSDKTLTLENQINLALIVHSLKKYSQKLVDENNLSDKSRPINTSLSKLEEFIRSLGIETFDYTGQKYNEGMNVIIVDTVKTDTAVDIIRETIEPAVIIDGNLVKKARVVKEINGGNNE